MKVYGKADVSFFEEPNKETVPLEKLEDISIDSKPQINPLSLESIIAKIIDTKKPIVGFFPNLDLGLIYQAFIDDLPPTYEQWTDHIN